MAVMRWGEDHSGHFEGVGRRTTVVAVMRGWEGDPSGRYEGGGKEEHNGRYGGLGRNKVAVLKGWEGDRSGSFEGVGGEDHNGQNVWGINVKC